MGVLNVKICMIVPHFLPHIGGGEQLYYDIAKGLKKEGHKVRVVTSDSGGVKGHSQYDGIDTYYYPWKIRFGHPVVCMADLDKHVKWADIVHTTMFTPATKSRLISKKYKKPCIITIHEVIGDKWYWFVKPSFKAFLFEMYEKFICMQKFDAVHVVSDSTKNDYYKYIGKSDRVFRVYNCSHMPEPEEYLGESISFREYFGLKDDERGFLFFGRPAINKGIFVLEEAVNILKRNNRLPSNVKFCWIIAAQPENERKTLLKQVKKHKLNDSIIIKDSLKRMELFKVISGADYVVVPSITEGFGFSAVEACTIGRPIIYSNGGSLPEVVFGKTLPFENRNAKDLARKLDCVIRKGDNSFVSVPEKKFEDKRMVDEIIDLYKNVLQSEGKMGESNLAIARVLRNGVYNLLPYSLLRFSYNLGVKVLFKNKYENMIKYLKKQDDNEIKKLLPEIQSEGKLRMIYGSWVKQYEKRNNKILKEKNGLKYVNHKCIDDSVKKMYFSKKMSSASCRLYYESIIIEQDSKSPHFYFSEKVKEKLKQGGTVLDLGGAEGVFALECVNYADKVLCFEADEKWIAPLKKTFAPYKNKIKLVRKFVSDVSEGEFITLDHYFSKKIPTDISVIKMDIEGFEQKALLGMKKTLEKNPDAIVLVCAYHTPEAEKEINEIMQNMGYTGEKRKGFIFCWAGEDFVEPYARRGVIEYSK